MADQNDELSLLFLAGDTGIGMATGPSLSNGNAFQVQHWTSYSFDSDYMTPSDGFAFELADDRVATLSAQIQIGKVIQISLGGAIQMTGRIDSVDFEYDRSTGTRLILKGRDLLGAVADATINPAVEASIQSTSTTTFAQAYQSIFSPFGFTINFAENDTGADVSIRSTIKLGAATTKANSSATQIPATKLSSQIKHQYKPNKSEGYLQYALRLAERNGWFIKSSADGHTVNFFAPTYDRISGPSASIIHRLSGLNSSNENNVISGKLHLNWAKQPSAILIAATSSGGNFRRSAAQVIQVNDITGYDLNGKILNDGTNDITTNLQSLISYYSGSGTILVDPNKQLQSVLPLCVNTNINNVSNGVTQPPNRVMYIYDENSMSPQEVLFYVRHRMSHLQSEFLTLDYILDGHTDKNTGAIWTPNTMVNVYDETYGIQSLMWVKKRTFTKSRNSGTQTHLTLSLPYIFTTNPGAS